MTTDDFFKGQSFKIDTYPEVRLYYNAKNGWLYVDGHQWCKLWSHDWVGFTVVLFPFDPKKIEYAECTLL